MKQSATLSLPKGDTLSLPKGWEIKKLGEIYSFKNGINFDKTQKVGEGILTVDVLNMFCDGLQVNTDNLYRIKKQIPEDYFLKRDDILIVRSSVKEEGVAWATFFKEANEPITYCGFIIRGRPIRALNAKYVIYYLRSYEVRNELIKKAVKSTITNINQALLSEVCIPLPPLPEQHRIVSILDDAFTAIAKAKANAERCLSLSKALFESYVQNVFSEKGEGWEEKTLGDSNLIEIIDGDRGKNYPTLKDFAEKGFCLFMNTKNVRPNGFEFNTTMFISEEKDKAMGKGKLKRYDVVMTTRGTIGNLGVYNTDVEFENIRINSGMLIFRPNLVKIIPEYLFEILRSGIIKDQIIKHATGAAQPQLPIKTLVNFTFPFPKSLKVQQSIVQKLDALSAETKKLEAIYQKKITDLEELKKSILQKAFNGEL